MDTEKTTGTLVLRQIDKALIGRVREYARARAIPLPLACARLLEAALRHHETRAAGALALNASRTAEQRSLSARRAGLARHGLTPETR